MSNNIVTYPLLGRNGRTGNCLFQIATTIAYAIEYNKEFVFPEWDKSKFFRSFLDGPLRNDLPVIKEKDFTYSELPFKSGDVSLEGYFQSELYFKKYEAFVRHWLTFNDLIQNKAEKLISELSKPNQSIVSIHFRFGDYLNNPFYVNLHNTEYYKEAIWKIYSLLGPAEIHALFLVFTDDIRLAAIELNKLKIFHPNVNFMVIHNDNEIEDLCLMSLCDKAIMANSSFSWWGGWLGKQKEIIAPKEWFGEVAKIDTRDLYTKEMILI